MGFHEIYTQPLTLTVEFPGTMIWFKSFEVRISCNKERSHINLIKKVALH